MVRNLLKCLKIVAFAGIFLYLSFFQNCGGTTIKDTEAANVSTDLGAALAWHPDFVRRAMGATKVFLEVEKADFYGSLMSSVMRFGALQARNDIKGVVSLVEAV